MLDADAVAEVEEIIRSVAAREIMPRFCALVAGDITEKAPGDLVTVADRAAEDELAVRLAAVLPGSIVVGEEAVAADPGVLAAIGGDTPVWIVDPIDGTHNFATDNPRFTTLVALAQHGQLLASWTFAPALELMATATAGGGAFVDGRRVFVAPTPAGLRHLDICTPQQKWWTPQQRAQFNALSGHAVALSFFDTSGLEYIELATGRRTAMVVTWEFPWDHAAGLLLHAEAGGVATVTDGTPFRLAGGNALPMVVAPDPVTAARLHAALTVPH